MARDFVHTAQIVEATIDVLKGADGDTHTGGLPAAWFTVGDKEELAVIEHGDWADYAAQNLMPDLPAILVRGLGPESTEGGGSGGVNETDELMRVVHIRRFDQCFKASGVVRKNMAQARGRYASVIGAALFNDPNRKLAVIAADGTRTEAPVTASDGATVDVINHLFDAWDMGHQVGNPNATEDVSLIRSFENRIWAIACDFRVRLRTGGAT